MASHKCACAWMSWLTPWAHSSTGKSPKSINRPCGSVSAPMRRWSVSGGTRCCPKPCSRSCFRNCCRRPEAFKRIPRNGNTCLCSGGHRKLSAACSQFKWTGSGWQPTSSRHNTGARKSCAASKAAARCATVARRPQVGSRWSRAHGSSRWTKSTGTLCDLGTARTAGSSSWIMCPWNPVQFWA